LLAKESEFKLNKMRVLKWEYYTGKLDEDQLKQYGWEPFPYVLKAEVNNYIEADDDINKRMAIKLMHEEIVDVCSAILKELNSRTFQLRDFIAWERFIQGV
jgi:Iap family predicted aminopeptidase